MSPDGTKASLPSTAWVSVWGGCGPLPRGWRRQSDQQDLSSRAGHHRKGPKKQNRNQRSRKRSQSHGARLRLQVSDRARGPLGLTPSHRSCRWNPLGDTQDPPTGLGRGYQEGVRLGSPKSVKNPSCPELRKKHPHPCHLPCMYFHQETKYQEHDTEKPILSTPITITCRTHVPLCRGPGCGARPQGGDRPPGKMNPSHSRTRGPTLPAGRASECAHSRS